MDGEVILDEDSISIVKREKNLTDIPLPLPPPVEGRGFINPLPWREREGRGGIDAYPGDGPVRCISRTTVVMQN